MQALAKTIEFLPVRLALSDAQAEQLRAALEIGLPFTSRPYRALAEQIGTTEEAVLEAIQTWQNEGLVKRMGLVVQHRALGYKANAMVVWDVPDQLVDHVGRLFKNAECVTLCYRRPRRLPDWPYNLFCMIHGRERDTVLQQIESLVARFQLEQIPRAVLFSVHSYKQCGARFTRRNLTLEG